MATNLDKSLADVIASRPKNNKRRTSRRLSAKSSLVGSPASKAVAASPSQRARAQKQTQSQVSGAPHADKIIVSNLPNDVNETQIKELFTQQIGPTKEVTLHYDPHGRSKGIASVTFSRRGDGTKAHQQYHNRLIDGS
ncbi:hypothetical protein K439DRAFT_308593 [Ramaria rubella]|nr:hypothetical protein K439DRAFT_308593 [Ramaria rubella]